MNGTEMTGVLENEKIDFLSLAFALSLILLIPFCPHRKKCSHLDFTPRRAANLNDLCTGASEALTTLALRRAPDTSPSFPFVPAPCPSAHLPSLSLCHQGNAGTVDETVLRRTWCTGDSVKTTCVHHSWGLPLQARDRGVLYKAVDGIQGLPPRSPTEQHLKSSVFRDDRIFDVCLFGF